MNQRSYRQRLRSATKEAQARRDRVRAEIERRKEQTPRPGDVVGFTSAPEQSVLWAILEKDSARRFLLVAADLHPFVGSSDVAVSAEAACGALCLRCGFEAWLDDEALGTARRISMLEPEDLNRARRKRAQIETGAVTGSVLERDNDGDLEYLDWLQEGPARAQAVLPY